VRTMLSFAALFLCGSALAQGFPGGGGGGHGRHGPPPADAEHRPPQQTAKAPEPLETMLRTAHELRQDLMLNATQTERWAEMQADLREVLDKRRSLAPKPSKTAQVPNPALLFIQDTAAAEGALASALDKLSTSMQAAFDALDERQKKVFVEKMTAALSTTAAL